MDRPGNRTTPKHKNPIAWTRSIYPGGLDICIVSLVLSGQNPHIHDKAIATMG